MIHQEFLSTLSLRRATCLFCEKLQLRLIFLSTLSLRRATDDAINGCNPDFISIHALLAESDQANAVDQILPGHISIHALLAESDSQWMCHSTKFWIFLSTLSLRRATHPCVTLSNGRAYFYPRSPCGERLYDTYAKVLRVNISIHALLAESDTQCRL